MLHNYYTQIYIIYNNYIYTLDHTKLVAALPDIHIDDIHTAMAKVFQRMRVNLEKEGLYI